MNITLLSLHLIHFISKNPSFLIPSYQSHTSFILQSCFFKYSFTNTYLSNPNNFLLISRTNFRFFLDSPIKIEKTYVTDAHVKFNKVAIYDTSFICKDSTFSDCQSIFGQGGAIFSLSSTILENCYFERCESELGGAIFSGSDIDYFSTTFINCIGIKGGGCVFSDHPEKIIITFCTFSRSLSSTGGALTVGSNGQSVFRYNNVSTCGSFTSNGAFDLSYLATELYFIIFDQCFAAKSTSGIRFYKNKGISIKSNLFIFMNSNDAQTHEGAVLTIIDPQEPCQISHCSFSKTQKISGYTIFVENLSPTDGSEFDAKEVKIINCCFSYQKDVEVNNNTYINFINESNQESLFSASCDDFIQLLLPRKIGYRNEIEHKEEPILEKLIKNYVVWIISKDIIYLLIIGFIFGFLIWVAYLYFIKRRRHHRHRQRRAFQVL